MRLWFDVRRRARAAVAPVIASALAGYFLYHLVEGDRGLLAYVRLKQDIQAAETVAAKVRAERVRLERRVALLRPDGLDLDILDEQARYVLGLVHPDDVVLYDPGD